MHKINPLVTVLSLIFMSVSQWEGWDVSCALVPEQEHSMQIRNFIHIVSREFLRNKCDSPLRQDGRKPLATFALGGEGQSPQHQTGI